MFMKYSEIIFFIKLKFIIGRRKYAWACMPLHFIYCDECIWTQNFKMIQNVLKWCENSFGIKRNKKKTKEKKKGKPSPFSLSARRPGFPFFSPQPSSLFRPSTPPLPPRLGPERGPGTLARWPSPLSSLAGKRTPRLRSPTGGPLSSVALLQPRVGRNLNSVSRAGHRIPGNLGFP